jgi:hypothetical protein
MKFQKAVKNNRPVRLELQGLYNAGKTYSALTLAKTFSGVRRTLLVDTETQRSSLYSDLFDFDVAHLQSFEPGGLQGIVAEAVKQGYGTLIVDSFSDYWVGIGGVLSIANGRFSGWKVASPQQDHLLLSLLSAPIHLIATLRMKPGYQATVDPNGKQVVTRLGLEPVQRDDCPYKFDWVMEMSENHEAKMIKSPLPELEYSNLGKPDTELANKMLDFLAGNGIAEKQEQQVAVKEERLI